MKIKTRLTLLYAALIFTLITVANTILILSVHEYLDNQRITRIKNKVQDIESLISSYNNTQSKSQTYNFLTELIKNHTLGDSFYFQLSDNKGNITAKSVNLRNSLMPINASGTLKEISLELINNKNELKKLNLLYFSSVIKLDGKYFSYIQIGWDLETKNKLNNRLILFTISETIILLFLSLIVGNIMSYRALKPMVNITDYVKSMAGKDLLTTIDTKNFSNDEIGELVNTFNQLIKRITDVFNLQQAFISDASHELRSPLTAIRGYAQLALKRGKDNSEIFNESINVIVKETKRLEMLVEDMLLLARSGEKKIKKDKTDLQLLIKELVDEIFKLNNKNIFINTIKDDVYVYANSDAIKRVFINLISNSLKAINPDVGQIYISFKINNNNIDVEIKDNGIGIDQEHLSHIFERFYRIETSRERDKGGTGLGLPIAKEIIEDHNGTITVYSELRHQTIFTVSLPIFKTSTNSVLTNKI